MPATMSWTEADGRHSMLVDDDGTITHWNDRGQLCREGCGEQAEPDENGRCRFCAGTTDPEEGAQ